MFILLMDDLTRAVAQFYASGWSAGGMNGGFNPPPAPDNSTIFVDAPSHEEQREELELRNSKEWKESERHILRLEAKKSLRIKV